MDEKSFDLDIGYYILAALVEYCKAEHIMPEYDQDCWTLFMQQCFGEQLQSKEAEEESGPQKVYHVWRDGEYIVITLGFVSMIVSDDMMEEFLCEKWLQTRLALLQLNSWGFDIAFLGDKAFGIRLEVYPVIGGYREGGNYPSVTLFTPDDIKRRTRHLGNN